MAQFTTIKAKEPSFFLPGSLSDLQIYLLLTRTFLDLRNRQPTGLSAFSNEVTQERGRSMASQNRQSQNNGFENASKSAVPEHPPALKQAAVQPSGTRGDNPSTAGPGQTGVRSGTPENASGHLNPSAPEDVNITPGTDKTK
ncbi:MAG: hypothetical protein ABI380_06500 [Edaphobacter sp.]